ncbi:hypothetical protein ES332_A03G012100v1 [Gossypium tomentosum]|uniref:Sieve element occlusion N-terminal domain-containing protein n=1 Tax=Gossypium tomentosum TaxID=34277 RepID=A0A5D2R0Q9_GOSTO|nr:hypothetical protein ES332_A03G012100v1 [Gossypium tomentosum]
MARPTQVSSSSKTSQQSMRNEHWMFDDAMNERIRSTHVPDGRVVDVTPVLQVTRNVLRHIIPNINLSMNGHIDASDDQTSLSAVDGALDALHKICCELSCKCSKGGDAHATTMAIFNMLSSYSWGAKVVLTIAAFAVNFGEFWLTAQLCTSNSLAKSVALLKKPYILEHSQTLKTHFDALSNLINAMVDVTKCIVELTELPSKYISIDEPPFSTAMAHIHTATYWIISSVIVCTRFTTSTSEAWELSSLTHKVSSIHEHLQSQLCLCYERIDEKKLMEAFAHFKRTIETPQVDNLMILQNIFGKEENLLNLDRAEVYINVLRRKYVLLLISDIDISKEEIRVLEVVYKERLPIVDRTTWNNGYQEKFSTLQSIMSWYTVSHHVAIEPAVIKYIREEWGFVKKPITVTLNPQGKVLCPNALSMMWIWGNSAFPFSSEKEESFWKAKPWTLDLIVGHLETNLPTWKVVCFYGGVKMEWIESFTTATKGVANALDIGIEMVYVRKKNARERGKKITDHQNFNEVQQILPTSSGTTKYISLQNISETLQIGRKNNALSREWNVYILIIENDVLKQEVMTMLGYDSSKNGWAVFYTGSGEMVKANGEKEKLAKQMGFIPALRKKLEGVIQYHHCTRLILPSNGGRILERVQCAECGCPMELNFLYRCCAE